MLAMTPNFGVLVNDNLGPVSYHGKYWGWGERLSGHFMFGATKAGQEHFLMKSNKKCKVHPCTGTEALYRPYGPKGE